MLNVEPQLEIVVHFTDETTREFVCDHDDAGAAIRDLMAQDLTPQERSQIAEIEVAR